MKIAFTVRGEPVAQPRVKAARIGGFIRVYTPSTAKKWKGLVAAAARPFLPSVPIEVPLVLALAFRFKRPKSHLRKGGELTKSAPRHHRSKPDIDNLAKAVMDALTDAGLWKDDSQIVALFTSKTYAEDEGVSVLALQCPETTFPAPSVALTTLLPITGSTESTASPAATTQEEEPKCTTKKKRSASSSLTGTPKASLPESSPKPLVKSGGTQSANTKANHAKSPTTVTSRGSW